MVWNTLEEMIKNIMNKIVITRIFDKLNFTLRNDNGIHKINKNALLCINPAKITNTAKSKYFLFFINKDKANITIEIATNCLNADSPNVKIPKVKNISAENDTFFDSFLNEIKRREKVTP